jgi:opacity protein-like surface antigen
MLRARKLLILAALLAAPLPALAQSAETPVPGKTNAGKPATASSETGSPLGLTSVEGILSTIFQSGQSSFSGTGLRLHLHPSRMMEGFSLVPSLEYWRNSNELDTFGIKSTEKDATLGIEFRYNFPRESAFKPYLGIGYGLHFLSSEFEATTLGISGNDSVTLGGVSALGGISMPITDRLVNVFELKFHYLSDNSQTKLNYGLAWNF